MDLAGYDNVYDEQFLKQNLSIHKHNETDRSSLVGKSYIPLEIQYFFVNYSKRKSFDLFHESFCLIRRNVKITCARKLDKFILDGR